MYDYSSPALCNWKEKERQMDKMDTQLLEVTSSEQQSCTGVCTAVLLLW